MASLSAREQEYQTIRSRIITMELKPGDPLNDRELAEQMGISRTPMREALIMLNIDHMLGELQHEERIRKFSLQTNENKSVCAAHTRILEMVLHGTAEELGEALESHLNRYKLSVEQARSVHPEYFTEG